MTLARISDTEKPEPITDPDLKKRHQKALGFFKASASFFSQQREREMQDLKFVEFGEQWDPQVKTQRQGNTAVDGLPITPPRPTITVDQLRGPCLQVASIRRQADIALEFVAKGGGATDDIAETFEDIARAIQQDSRADIARNWAADRAEKAGMGWYRIDTEYCLDKPDDDAAWNDQQIVYRRILNQASVYPDPLAQEPDFSDGKKLILTEDMAWDDYVDAYGDSYLADADGDSDLLTAVGDSHQAWIFNADGDDPTAGKTVRIAEVWEVIETSRTRVTLTDGSTAFEDEADDETIDPAGPRRRIKTRTIEWSKINGVEYLEKPREWNGAWIPLIPVIGEESNVNGERRWAGIVRPARDGAISYNVMRSAIIEAIALATKAPYIGYWKSIEKFQSWWKQSNVRNLFMLPLDEAYDKNGQLLPPPTTTVKNPVIDAMVVAANQAQQDVRTATGISAVALGELDPANRSGAAIKALQGQSEQGAGIYLDNLKRISVPYEGRVLRDMIPRIYDRPGRVVAAHGKDDQRRMVMLNQPFQMQGKTPIAVDGWEPHRPTPQGSTLIDLSQGEYAVTAVVGKSYPTRKKEAADYIGNIIQATPPEYAMALTPALLEEQDYPGAQRIAAIAKKVLPPNIQAAYDEPNAQPDPQQLQAKLMQLQQALEQAQQQIATKEAEAMAKAKANIMEAQAKAQLPPSADAQLAAQAGIEKQKISTAGTMTVGLAKVDAENQRSFADAFEAKLAHDEGFRIDVAKLHAQIASKQAEQAAGHTHDMATMALEHAHEAQMAAQGAQHAQDLAVTSAALQPPDQGTPNA